MNARTGCGPAVITRIDEARTKPLLRRSRVKGARRVRGLRVIMARPAGCKAKVPPSTGNRLAGRYVTRRKRERERETEENITICCTWTMSSRLAASGVEGDGERKSDRRGGQVVIAVTERDGITAIKLVARRND